MVKIEKIRTALEETGKEKQSRISFRLNLSQLWDYTQPYEAEHLLF